MRAGAGVRIHLRRVSRTGAGGGGGGSYSRHCARRARSHCTRAAPRGLVAVPHCCNHALRPTAYRPVDAPSYRLNSRTLATATTATETGTGQLGPLQEYDRRVEQGLLKNDEHQRGKKLPV